MQTQEWTKDSFDWLDGSGKINIKDRRNGVVKNKPDYSLELAYIAILINKKR